MSFAALTTPPTSRAPSASLRDYATKQNYMKAVKRAKPRTLEMPHRCRPRVAEAPLAGVGANTTAARNKYTAETPATRRPHNRTSAARRRKMPLRSGSGGGSGGGSIVRRGGGRGGILLLLLTLLAAVVAVACGTDVVSSETDSLQQTLNITATRNTTTTLITPTNTTAETIEAAQRLSLSTTTMPSEATTATTTTATITTATIVTELNAAILNASEALLPAAESELESESEPNPHPNPAHDSDEAEDDASHPASDSLTKGFSIPTFLPPFPEFAMADLPAYTSQGQVTTATTTTTTTTAAATATRVYQAVGRAALTADLLQEQQDELYLAAYNKQQLPKRNLTLPSTNVTVQLGSHAYMPCHIRRLLNKPVSWVRVRDGHILSVDQTTFIADQRFQSIFKGENEYTWSLQIKYVQENDAGWYECQVSTEPKMSAKVHLGVVVPRTELIGEKTRFVKQGSKVALHCIVRGTLDPPTYIIWLRGKTQIMDDNKMGKYTQIDRNIFGNTSDNQNTIGSLIIPFVRKEDTGNYTCQPSNSEEVQVTLHVLLSGEYSASAIMSAARSYQPNAPYFLLLLPLLALTPT